MDKETILKNLRAHKNDIESFGVSQIGLFGSHISGNANVDSDIDMYVIFEECKSSYDNLFGLYDYLEALFPGKKVDIITKGGVSPYLEPEIMDNTIYA